MRKISNLMKFAVIIIGLAQSTAVFSQSIPEVLYYKFDRTDSIVLNMASNIRPGTDTAHILGSMYQDSTGQCGHALVGSGNSSLTDYMDTYYAPDLGAGSWTLSFWTKNITPSTVLFYIFGDENTSSFRCFTNGVAGAGNWILRGAGLADIYVNGGAIMAPTMTTFVYDSLTSNVYAYLNGTLVSTVAQTTANLTGTGPLKVGGYGANTGLPAGGLMDEFRLYDRALSAAEVLELFDMATYESVVETACDSMISPSGLYTWNTSGTYNDTIANAMGCDSIITFDLTVLQSTTGNLSASECNGFVSPSGNHFWTVSGTYQDIIPNAAGCDSIIDINLTIINVDTTVTSDGITLTSNNSSASYQWVDCGNAYAAIAGETNQSFTPTVNGSYAVVVTGSCTDTSACFVFNNVGINDAYANAVVSVFPNPNTGNFSISTNKVAETIVVSDMIGNEISRYIPSTNITEISLSDFGPGVYDVNVKIDNIVKHIRVIISQ